MTPRRALIALGGLAGLLAVLFVVAVSQPAVADQGACPPVPQQTDVEQHTGALPARLVAGVAYDAGFRGRDLTIAVAVSSAESGFDNTATHLNDDGSTDYGLWQINSVHAELLAQHDWRSPTENAVMAKAVFDGSGWGAWTTYNTGAYLRHMDEAAAATSRLAPAATQSVVMPPTTTCQGLGGTPNIPGASEAQVLAASGLMLTPGQQADIESGGIDPRLLALLAWLGKAHHDVAFSAIRADHRPGSNHEAGRAVDISTVDGMVCKPYGPNDPCGQLAISLARMTGPMRSTELIACFDPDNNPATDNGGGNATIWAQPSDHCNHIHVGWDG